MSTWAVIQFQLEDRQLIDAQYRNFRNAILEERYEDAYLLYMAPGYRENNSLSEFRKTIASNYFPELIADRLVDISFFSNTAKLYPEYDKYGDFWQNTIILSWEKVGGSWFLTGEIGYMLD
jgi:hypothetical protein